MLVCVASKTFTVSDNIAILFCYALNPYDTGFENPSDPVTAYGFVLKSHSAAFYNIKSANRTWVGLDLISMSYWKSC